MAITVTHQPDLGLLARAGYYVGAGQDMQRQQEMAQRERMQIRGLNYNIASQNLANLNAMNRMDRGAQIQAGLQGQRDDARARNQAAFQDQRQGFEREMMDIEKDDRRDRIQADFENRRELLRLKGVADSEADQVSFMFRRSDSVLHSIRDLIEDGYEFDGGDRALYEAGLSQINTAMKDKTLSGSQRAQTAFRIAETLPVPIKKIPTTEESIDDGVVERNYTLPNGDEIKALFGMDRDGMPRMLGSFEMDQKLDDSGELSISSQVLTDPAVYLKYRAQAVKELTTVNDEGSTTLPGEEAISARIKQMIDGTPDQGEGEPDKSKPSKPTHKYDPETGSYTR